MQKDIFICHAGEDKSSIVRPLVSGLSDRGINCWLDEAEITPGDSITEKVNEGLKISNYIVVVFSRAFMSKNWPKRELWSVLNIEAKSGEKTIIPIIVGTQPEVEYILDEFPLLNDKLFLLWNGDLNRVANSIQSVVSQDKTNFPRNNVVIHNCGHCQTPFQHGVHVCLGCKGTIIYGLNNSERQYCFQISSMIIGLILLLSFLKIYSYLNSTDSFGFSLNISSIPIIIGIGGALILGGAYFITSRYALMKKDLVRTFR